MLVSYERRQTIYTGERFISYSRDTKKVFGWDKRVGI